ncbi:MAG TPA: enoyl-CoA hydratase-related protein [Candidatus Thermoplasmatota archaeon]
MTGTVSDERDGAVAVITLRRPESLNAFDLEMVRSLAGAVERARGDAAVRAVLLRAEGDHFCAGGDLAAMRAAADPSAYVRQLASAAGRALLALRSAPQPVVAALKGAVAGGGVGLALGADVRVAAEGTRFSLAFLRVGLTPDTGTTWMLPRLIGRARTMEMAFSHEPVRAAEAHAWGLVHRVVPAADLEAEALRTARELASLPPVAVREMKGLIDGAELDGLRAHLDADAEAVARAAATQDFREGLDAFFGKRAPRFEGR